MKSAVRFGLGLAVVFEVVIALALRFMPAKSSDPVATQVAVATLAPWWAFFASLAAATIGVSVLAGRSWERMGAVERILTILPALLPLVLLRFLFTAAIALVMILGLLAAAIAVIAIGGSAVSSAGSSPRSGSSRHDVRDGYGTRLGTFESDTGVMRDKYGNKLGSLDKRTGEIRDKYGNKLGSID